jgi:hypothetical protein
MMPVGMNMDMAAPNQDLSLAGSASWSSATTAAAQTTTAAQNGMPYWAHHQDRQLAGRALQGPPPSLSRVPHRSHSMTSYHQEQQEYLIGHLAQLRASGAQPAASQPGQAPPHTQDEGLREMLVDGSPPEGFGSNTRREMFAPQSLPPHQAFNGFDDFQQPQYAMKFESSSPAL